MPQRKKVIRRKVVIGTRRKNNQCINIRNCTNESSEGEEEWVEPNKTSGTWGDIYRETSFRLYTWQ